MTKKVYIALADRIKLANNSLYANCYFNEDCLEVLADFLESENPRFNRDRWLDYIDGKCGPDGGKIKPTCKRNPEWKNQSIAEAEEGGS